MASSAADIGANASSYQGSSALGGGSFGSFQLDTKPIEDLAKYTMLYNKSEYDQRQKDVEATAKEIADYMSFDVVNGIPKFSKILQDKNDKLQKFVSENPDAINYKNRKLWTEYQKLRGDLGNDIASAKLNEVIYMARKKEIEDETLPLEKERLQKTLDKDIETLDIRGRLKHSDKFDVKPVDVGTVPILEIQTTDVGRNIIGTATDKLPDMRVARNTVSGLATGLLKIAGDKGQFGDQYEAAVASGKLEPVLSSEYFNKAIQTYKSDPKFQNPDGTLDIDKVIAVDDGIVGQNLMNVKSFNKGMRDIKKRINDGYFKDKFNRQLGFSNDASGLRESDYKEINIDDGYSPEEILLTKMLAQTRITPPRTIKIDQTDLGIKAGHLAVAWKNAESERIRANKPTGDKATESGITTPAILFGEHINRLKSYFGKNSGQDFAVEFKGIDDKTVKALGITEGQRVVYRPDGNFVIQAKVSTGLGKDKKENWQDVRVGTIEDLKQGFINSVKGGLSADGTQTKEFQDESEKGFNSIFGTTSGSMIFNQWGKPVPATTEDPNKGLTPAQIEFKKKYGLK